MQTIELYIDDYSNWYYNEYNICMTILTEKRDIHMQKRLVLTKNEQEIMNLLWEEAKPLSRSDIINLSIERSWKASSIHILLNQLLEKEAIRVDGFVKTGKNYGRTFVPAFTEEEYHAMQFRSSGCYRKAGAAALVDFVAAFIQGEAMDTGIIDRLEKLLEDKRSELESK